MIIEMSLLILLLYQDLGLAVSGQTLQDDDLPTPEECVTKIAALLKSVFSNRQKNILFYFFILFICTMHFYFFYFQNHRPYKRIFIEIYL